MTAAAAAPQLPGTYDAVVPHHVRGANGETIDMIRRLDWAYGRGLSGHAGVYRGGVEAGLGSKFNGDGGPLMHFARFTGVGATPSLKGTLNGQGQALPSTVQVAALNPVLATILRNQMGTVGVSGT